MIATSFDVPAGRAALDCPLALSWTARTTPWRLLGDAANSLRLALEREEAEQARQQAEGLRRSHQLQREFFSRLSHELRTPLTAIRGYASSLLASDVTWDDESKTRFLNRISSESARMGRLGRGPAGFFGDRVRAVASGARLVRSGARAGGGRLLLAARSGPPQSRCDCDPGIGPVWADHDRLEQVFVNLLENAFRHNPPGVHVAMTSARNRSSGHQGLR